MKELAVTAAFAPLVGALIAGLGGRWLTRQGAHTAAIFSVLLSFLASCVIFWRVLQGETFNDRSTPGSPATPTASRSAS